MFLSPSLGDVCGAGTNHRDCYALLSWHIPLRCHSSCSHWSHT